MNCCHTSGTMAKLLSALCALGLAAGARAGIYPDDHWSYATQITTDSMDAFVQEGPCVRTAKVWVACLLRMRALALGSALGP